MRPIILFRGDKEEMDKASWFYDVTESRLDCHDRMVIGRYSVLPFYEELEKDLARQGCHLINSHAQHQWIADFQYYSIVKDYTAPTWHNLLETDWPGPFVIKGKTNSRKHQWNTSMYAADRDACVIVQRNLLGDSLIGQQGLIFRKYIPLVTYEIGMNGMRFTNEWRFFYYKEKCIVYGYYWSEASKTFYIPTDGMKQFANDVAALVAPYVNFFVLDIAEKEEGGWMLVEINDGQMSGLSCCDPSLFYCVMELEVG